MGNASQTFQPSRLPPSSNLPDFYRRTSMSFDMVLMHAFPN